MWGKSDRTYKKVTPVSWAAALPYGAFEAEDAGAGAGMVLLWVT